MSDDNDNGTALTGCLILFLKLCAGLAVIVVLIIIAFFVSCMT
jgi:hypothetical protein